MHAECFCSFRKGLHALVERSIGFFLLQRLVRVWNMLGYWGSLTVLLVPLGRLRGTTGAIVVQAVHWKPAKEQQSTGYSQVMKALFTGPVLMCCSQRDADV